MLIGRTRRRTRPPRHLAAEGLRPAIPSCRHRSEGVGRYRQRIHRHRFAPATNGQSIAECLAAVTSLEILGLIECSIAGEMSPSVVAGGRKREAGMRPEDQVHFDRGLIEDRRQGVKAGSRTAASSSFCGATLVLGSRLVRDMIYALGPRALGPIPLPPPPPVYSIRGTPSVRSRPFLRPGAARTAISPSRFGPPRRSMNTLPRLRAELGLGAITGSVLDTVYLGGGTPSRLGGGGVATFCVRARSRVHRAGRRDHNRSQPR